MDAVLQTRFAPIRNRDLPGPKTRFFGQQVLYLEAPGFGEPSAAEHDRVCLRHYQLIHFQGLFDIAKRGDRPAAPGRSVHNGSIDLYHAFSVSMEPP